MLLIGLFSQYFSQSSTEAFTIFEEAECHCANLDANHVKQDYLIAIGAATVEINVFFKDSSRKAAISDASSELLETVEKAFGQFLKELLHLIEAYP
jgi:hypothetical protein